VFFPLNNQPRAPQAGHRRCQLRVPLAGHRRREPLVAVLRRVEQPSSNVTTAVARQAELTQSNNPPSTPSRLCVNNSIFSASPRLRVSQPISCSTLPCSTLSRSVRLHVSRILPSPPRGRGAGGEGASTVHCPLPTAHSPANGRRGISLTEVLLSMFVMTVGILGLAALIPVGGSDVATAVRNDRSSNLGRAAFRDVQIRNWLNPNMWLDHTGAAVPTWVDVDMPDGTNQTTNLTASPLDRGNAFCIDPMFLGRFTPASDPTNRRAAFPYTLDNDPDSDNDPTQFFNPPRLQRGTLRAWPGSTLPIQQVQAERLFRSSDDLIFGFPDNEPDGRPFAALGSARQVRQFTGDYSWLITVAPTLDEMSNSGATTGAPRMFTVSVVVFQKRTIDLPDHNLANRIGTPPTERTVYCDFISGSGLGGGDVRLGLPIASGGLNSDPTKPELSDFPAVKPGQWIMLSGWHETSDPNGSFFLATSRWYRVVNAGPLKYESNADFPANINAMRTSADEWAQYVTLAGPDWWGSIGLNLVADADDPNRPPTVPGIPHTAHAAIIDGVVGVYEKTMHIDTRAFGVR